MDSQVAANNKLIKIRLFGAFRDLAPGGVFDLNLKGGETVAEMKLSLAAQLTVKHPTGKFDVSALVDKSALATESKVLDDGEIFSGSELAILPPVCGG